MPVTTPRGTREQFRGCLLGGAAGDALGSPVEFLSRTEILKEYGPEGIRELGFEYGRRGAITDDTQMTLFTADGYLRYDPLAPGEGAPRATAMRRAYERWLATQSLGIDGRARLNGWLYENRGLHGARAPGSTCLSALRDRPGTVEAHLAASNNSKGCGGVMRVAPLGLVAEDPYEYGCEAAALTHGHPLGYLSSGAMALLVAHALTAEGLPQAVERTLAEMPPEAAEVAEWMRRAADLALSDKPAENCLLHLGEGWVAEEALAVGLFCALRGESLEEALVLAVNHSGDSDSTGSIAGQIRGAGEGADAIPARWLEGLELREEIRQVADDLYEWSHDSRLRANPPEEWRRRYPAD